MSNFDSSPISAQSHGVDPDAPSALRRTTSDPKSVASHASVTLMDAIGTIIAAGTSSEIMVVETAERLLRTATAWLETLEQRRARLQEALDVRVSELEVLQAHIKSERRASESLANRAQEWAEQIQSEYTRKQALLDREAQQMAHHAESIQGSISDLLLDMSRIPDIPPTPEDGSPPENSSFPFHHDAHSNGTVKLDETRHG